MDVTLPCPYCGHMMRIDSNFFYAWLECDTCHATTPKVYRYGSWDEQKKQAVLAAERRPIRED